LLQAAAVADNQLPVAAVLEDLEHRQVFQ